MIGPDGKGASFFAVRYLIRMGASEQSVAAALCGSGCYRALVPELGKPHTVVVRLSGGGRPPSSVTFAQPARWPAPDASKLLRRATAVWRRLRSLVITERLGSDLTHVIHTRWKLDAPNELSYQIAGGSDAVVIGSRRWDRQPGQRWKESATQPLSVPALQWTGATNVHLLGSATVAGQSASVISFYDPTFGGYFKLWIDTNTLRTLQLTLVAAAHFMHHRYGGFNAPLAIVPPVTRH